ncbi:HEAT repeat-containing protein 2 [Phlyctochytrium planicorne]|nr:HEAT repeat-containing protein 2 [Phlyctochytrium planicorne]
MAPLVNPSKKAEQSQQIYQELIHLLAIKPLTKMEVFHKMYRFDRHETKRILKDIALKNLAGKYQLKGPRYFEVCFQAWPKYTAEERKLATENAFAVFEDPAYAKVLRAYLRRQPASPPASDPRSSCSPPPQPVQIQTSPRNNTHAPVEPPSPSASLTSTKKRARSEDSDDTEDSRFESAKRIKSEEMAASSSVTIPVADATIFVSEPSMEEFQVPCSPISTKRSFDDLEEGEVLESDVLEDGQIKEQSLQRDINVIVDSASDRNSKRRSLEKIYKETVGRPGKPIPAELAALLFPDLVRPLVKSLGDSVEKCRELSINIITGFIKAVEDILPALPTIIPAYSARLGEQEIVEPSEEIRLQLVSSLILMVDKAGADFAPGVDETVKILVRILLDPYPEVKKESCKLAICLAKNTPRAMMHHGATLTKALLPSLTHRHSAVRIMGLRALQDVTIADASGLEEASTLDALRVLTLDKTPVVREVLYEVAHQWLRRLTDRYSIGYKILPIMFSGLTDDVAKLKTLTESYLNDLGMLYETEWESRVKDELDFTIGIGNVNLLQGRPRVGCRHLARDNTQKIVTKLIEGMQDWSPETRLKSAAVLRAFIPYTEENITGYIGALLPAIYKVLASDEVEIMIETERVAETVGRYVDPDLYIGLLLNHIRSNSDALSFKLGCLKALRGLLRGTPAQRLRAHLKALTDAMGDAEMAGSENILVLRDVAELTLVLVRKLADSFSAEGSAQALGSVVKSSGDVRSGNGGMAGVEMDVDDNGKKMKVEDKVDDLEDIGFDIFVILVTLSSFAGSDNVKGWPEMKVAVSESFNIIKNAYGINSELDLFSMHFSRLLSNLIAESEQWTRFSPELRVMETLFLSSGNLVGAHLDQIIPFIGSLCVDARDIELRMSVLQTSKKLLSLNLESLNHTNKLLFLLPAILQKIVWVSAVWRSSRKEAIVRKLAIENLLAVLTAVSNLEAGEDGAAALNQGLSPLFEESSAFVPTILGCLDEDDAKTREMALESLKLLFQSALYASVKLNAPMLKKIYPEVLKRLDDAVDDIRVRACHVLITFAGVLERFHAQNPPREDGTLGYVDAKNNYVEIRLDDVHWVTMIKGICIHVDDSNFSVNAAASEALLHVAKVSPAAVVREQIASIRGRYRNVEALDKVLESLQ